MSNQTNSFSSPLNQEIIQTIDELNLSIIQKHHIRILAHCLEIFKEIAKNNMSTLDEEKLLKEWCEKKANKFNDKNFNEIFYEQMISAAKKLRYFSKNIKKNFIDLDLDDLIILVQQSSDN